MRWLSLGFGVTLLACEFHGASPGASIDAATLGDANGQPDAAIDDEAAACLTEYNDLVVGTRRYKFVRDDFTHSEALSNCAASGGQLAVIETPAENQEIATAINDQGVRNNSCPAFVQCAWFGLSQTIGTNEPDLGWRWSDQSAHVTSEGSWSAFQPNDIDTTENGQEDCAQLWATGLTANWNDVSCATPLPSICECPGS